MCIRDRAWTSPRIQDRTVRDLRAKEEGLEKVREKI